MSIEEHFKLYFLGTLAMSSIASMNSHSWLPVLSALAGGMVLVLGHAAFLDLKERRKTRIQNRTHVKRFGHAVRTLCSVFEKKYRERVMEPCIAELETEYAKARSRKQTGPFRYFFRAWVEVGFRLRAAGLVAGGLIHAMKSKLGRAIVGLIGLLAGKGAVDWLRKMFAELFGRLP